MIMEEHDLGMAVQILPSYLPCLYTENNNSRIQKHIIGKWKVEHKKHYKDF